MRDLLKRIAAGTALLALFAGLACGASVGRQHMAGSVMSYLYPGAQEAPPVLPATTLRLPTSVGIAFVPENEYGWSVMDEVSKREVLRRVKQEFESRKDLIERIEEIPSTYLTKGGGFANLEQVRTMFRTDVVCLLGYDQLQATTETKASFFYLTILGAYLVPGNKNETRTMMEATVYDVASRRLLFRAPGQASSARHSTLVNLDKNQMADAVEGIRKATDDLIPNLRYALADFEQRVKAGTAEVAVQRRDASGKWVGGAWGAAEFVLLALLAAGYLLLRPGRPA